MLAPSLAIWAVLAGSFPDVEADRGEELARRLGSRLYQIRETAETELLSLGRGALPALRTAKRSRDLEVQLRAGSILERIEGNLLLEPTPIALRSRDMPLVDLVDRIRRESGVSLMLMPSDPRTWKDRRVTIDSQDPLPFWSAVDRLCEAANLHYVLGASVVGSQTYEPVFVLFDKGAPKPSMVVDRGPVRIQLSVVQNAAQSGMSTQGLVPVAPFRDGPGLRFDRPGRGASISQTARAIHLQFQFVAEPRLALLNQGPVRISEAIDDKGQSLGSNLGPNAGTFPAAYYGMSPTHSLRLIHQLNLPRDQEPTSLRRLRGSLPVVIATRKSDPIDIALPDGVGKAFRNDETILRVANLSTRSPQTPITTMEVVLKTHASQVPPQPMNEFDLSGFRPEVSPQQLEILDANGRVMTWYPSGIRSDSEGTRVTLTFAVNGATQTPARVRFYGLTRTSTELDFSFQDVSLK